MSCKIKHFGIIKGVEPNHIQVSITQESACKACTESKKCAISEKKNKIIDIYNLDTAQTLNIGDKVIIVEETIVGMKAVMLAFVFSFLILLISLFVYLYFTQNEVLSAILSIATLIPYYISLYYIRGKLKKDLSFRLELM